MASFPNNSGIQRMASLEAKTLRKKITNHLQKSHIIIIHLESQVPFF